MEKSAKIVGAPKTILDIATGTGDLDINGRNKCGKDNWLRYICRDA
jgi:ubiquinone/menaquinone biosynthesis C-methylase UbiE